MTPTLIPNTAKWVKQQQYLQCLKIACISFPALRGLFILYTHMLSMAKVRRFS